MRHRAKLEGRLAAFPRAEDATVAVEFAMLFPFLLALLGGTYEISRAVDTSRRLTTAAIAASNMIATSTTGTVSSLDLHYAVDSTMIDFPGVLADSYSKGVDWKSDISISLAGITFTPTPSGCTSGCKYVANVVWTGGSAQRGCGTTIAAASNTASPTPATLPQDLFNTVTGPSGTMPPPFAVVVDVAYAWTPLVFTSLIGPVTIRRSAYVNPRYVSQLTYQAVSSDDGYGRKCPGY